MLKKLRKTQKGSAAVETALVLPLFIYLSMLIIEASLIHYYQSALDNALFETIRFSKVSQEVRSQGNFEDDVRDVIADNVYGFYDTGNLVVTTDVSVDFDTEFGASEFCVNPNNAADTFECDPDPDLSFPCPSGFVWDDTDRDGQCDAATPPLVLGEGGDIITVIALYKWTPLTPGIRFFFGTAGDSTDDRNFNNILQANEDGDHVIVTGMTYRNEE